MNEAGNGTSSPIEPQLRDSRSPADHSRQTQHDAKALAEAVRDATGGVQRLLTAQVDAATAQHLGRSRWGWVPPGMKRRRQLLVVFGIGGSMFAWLLPGCSLPIGRRSTPPSPVTAPQVEEVPNAKGLKVEQVGSASWYGPELDGEETASGETFDQNELTAAHRTLPLGTKAVVTNLETGKSVEVTINDRGPYEKGRVIDLSRAAARQIGMSKKGVAKVKIETITPPESD